MTFAATAIVGGSIIGGLISAGGAERAGEASAASYDRATDESRRQYNQTREDWAPWMESGGNALNRLDRASTGDMSDFQTSPGYQFRLDEGTRNLENRFSVKGGGGNAMRALNDYSQGMASNEFGNWWNRQAGMAGMGMNATGSMTAQNTQQSGMIGNYMTGAGNARASGIMGGANAWNNALQAGIGNWMYAKGNKII